ncbi:hypothetical protein E2562_027875 [Oryza meyeriana var. granulata]|uniref:Uncharacterized protein n=1 Tax=Oryza meyeriana var. granulata TaxID=110450 RepID=A0A6G1CUA0_9ORYZ|nr:hypothetical protein E2562_027875 [Oryza meyeriana var. granulata]
MAREDGAPRDADEHTPRDKRKHVAVDEYMGGSGDKLQREANIVRLPLCKDDQGGSKRPAGLVEPIHDGRHKKERHARLDKAPPPKPSARSLQVE